jgi:hypothetical protein
LISFIWSPELIPLPLIKNKLQLERDGDRHMPEDIIKIEIAHGSRAACGF